MCAVPNVVVYYYYYYYYYYLITETRCDWVHWHRGLLYQAVIMDVYEAQVE